MCNKKNHFWAKYLLNFCHKHEKNLQQKAPSDKIIKIAFCSQYLYKIAVIFCECRCSDAVENSISLLNEDVEAVAAWADLNG